MGDREEGEGSSRKLVESQGGREGEGDGSFFVDKKEVEFGIRCRFKARMRRRQVRGLVDVTSKNVLQNTRLMIQDGQMSSVSAEGRMFA